MIIKPKVRGFICTTTHPVGCEKNVLEQIEATRARGLDASKGPKKVLVIGASSGYGLAARVTAAFGYGADTLGVFFEKPGSEKKPGTAGWYNSAAFDKFAKQEGLYSKSINGDAFSHEARDKAIELIKADMGQIDLVVYSLASPVRKLPDSGELKRSCLKPIGETYRATAIDTNKDTIIEAQVEPATEQEIADTIDVMGGQDWELWMEALSEAGVLAPGARSVAFSYIGTEITWPIYWHGALGKAKEDLDRAASAIDDSLKQSGGGANVAVLKSVVTQASAAIPVMPLYIAMVYRVMKEQGLHEGTIDQLNRLFGERLYGGEATTDDVGRLRLDDWELRDDVQQACKDLWPQVTSDNLFDITDYAGYKHEFLKLFGFERDDVDYDADVDPVAEFDVVQL
ncbi:MULTISPECIES: enoyl-ACP reductase FabV [Halomonas]|uniref:Enoyl-[acyl-carrier-protein] reductase [NADH] n=3 Tax=Halomonas TaxID=2745 RepID=A0AAU7KJ46_9GAMM|nr:MULTISPECIES: enoyl-ACP reductase FabV [Halomonas]MBR9770800.1 trans-2-enoyl-CoA reductase family protein [Gammaproteobacteria bacterium]MCO7216396.1 trans-2-enoyl-CoA reductase family protein [Halomonas sp. OfavH-34-E]KJZ18383.1 trans-2-enoyl-CoA reductase [Halomonas sp. S2151]MAR72985.1 enoyl-[acyl-carrier-protein] reductase FabV [Halomonas sp.]MBS8268410.1 trans-2-enoyl-CoA reductase family protein [Halomonas litopenaei]